MYMKPTPVRHVKHAAMKPLMGLLKNEGNVSTLVMSLSEAETERMQHLHFLIVSLRTLCILKDKSLS